MVGICGWSMTQPRQAWWELIVPTTAGGLNIIKPIRDNNEKKPVYEKAAEDYLKRIK